MKSHHKARLVKFGLPTGVALAILVGVLSFPYITGKYSPYTSLGVIYYFDDWRMVNTMEYVVMFALIQFFIIAFVLGILSLKFTRLKSKNEYRASLLLIISMSIFLLAVLLFVIWIASGLFTTSLNDAVDGNKMDIVSVIIAYTIAYVLPTLILFFALVSLIFWLIYYIPTRWLPTKKHQFNYRIFEKSSVPWTGKNKQLKIICWVGLGVAMSEVVLTVISIHYGNSDTEIYTNLWAKIWFGTMHHFTELSNLWVAIFFIIFLVNYKLKFLKTSALITTTFTYITVTFLIADFLLAPFMILNHSSGMINMGFGTKSTWYDWIKTFLFHVLQPIIVLLFFIFFCKSKRQYLPWKFCKIVPVTMIFPVLYLVYAITINFLPIGHLQIQSPNGQPIMVYSGVSVYGYFTCINPQIHASVFSDDKPIWEGKFANVIWYIFAICLFLALAFYYNWIERHTMALRYLREHKTYRPNYHLRRN